ncbi:MAG: hypothetical protein IKY83_06180 [Proteobacteria bacterium]|nr:hypothetical protein [Pseudomonadota bacterium]
MNYKVILAALSACAIFAGCSDDNAASVSAQRCQNEGESYCSGTNKVLTCTDGVLKENSCGTSKICYNGRCTQKCIKSQFITECVSNASINICSDEGYVETIVCDEGNICVNGICRDESMGNCDPSFAAQCRGDSTALKCISGAIVSEKCRNGNICRNGSCQAPVPCIETTYQPRCDGPQSYTACQNGYETYLKCEGDMLCSNGKCANQCEEGYKGCTDDGWTSVSCDNGVLKKTPCLGGQSCIDGECKAPAECDPETFVAVCEDGKAKKCLSSGKISLEICQNGTECYNGACVTDGPCNIDTFKPVCIDKTTVQLCGDNSLKTTVSCDNGYTCEGGICQNFPKTCTTGELSCMSASVMRECIDGAWHARYCNIPTEACVAGSCVNTADTEKCDESAAPVCKDNEIVACEHGYVVTTKCGENQHCEAGTCFDDIIEGGKCDPESFQQQCLDDKNTALCSEGTIIKVACGEGSCQAGECVPPPCDAASFTTECKDDLNYTVCINNKIDQAKCPDNTHCSNGKCIDNSTPGEKCDEASFVAICDTTKSLISCENSIVTKTDCPNDKPLCLNGKCIETECDPSTYGTRCKDDGKTPLWCNGGFIQELSVCPQSEPVCLNGKCVECNEASTLPTCQGTAHALICQSNHKYKLFECDYDEACIEGKGCVNKCGENFQNHCDEQGRRVYCTDKGEIATETCAYQYACNNGACENLYGQPCLPATYKGKCIENGSNIYAQICDPATKTINFLNCSDTVNRVCGNINGITSCYIRCDASDLQLDVTWCETLSNRNYVGKCEQGTDYKGSSMYGAFRRNAFCQNNNSVSCRTASNGHIVFDYLNCGLMGGNTKTCTSNTCAFASCASASATCSGTVATNCIWDPSHNDGDGGYVMTAMDCSGVKGTCAVLNPDGVNRAMCNATFTDTSTNKTWSSLGTCDGDVLYRLYWGESANKPIISNIKCHSACISKSQNGVSYAYCE